MNIRNKIATLNTKLFNVLQINIFKIILSDRNYKLTSCSIVSIGWLNGWGLDSFSNILTHIWCLMLAVSEDLSWSENFNSYFWPLHTTSLWAYTQQWQLGSKSENPKRAKEKSVSFTHELKPCFEANKHRCLIDLVSPSITFNHFHCALLVKAVTDPSWDQWNGSETLLQN